MTIPLADIFWPAHVRPKNHFIEKSTREGAFFIAEGGRYRETAFLLPVGPYRNGGQPQSG
jgi:hypothetical protein